MKRARIILCIFLGICFLLCLGSVYAAHLPHEKDNCFKGGSADGWSYATVISTMYKGGSGDGHSMFAMTTDTAIGYGAKNKLVFIAHPTNSIKNTPLATSPVVQVQDATNNPVLDATDSITVAIYNDPTGGLANLTGTKTKQAQAGTGSATFNDLKIDQAGNGFSLSADATGLSPAYSNSFNVAKYGTKVKLAYLQHPSNSFVNKPLITMPIVAILDAYNNLVEDPTATDQITLTAQGGGGGTLYGDTAKNAINGIADWTGSNIYINKGGKNYTLKAEALGLTTVTSNTFNVSTPPVTLSLSGSFAVDGTGQVTLTYTVKDAESDLCNFTTDPTQVQYSLDNLSWSNATISGTTSGITSSPTGIVHNDLIWEAGVDIPSVEDGEVYFRIKIHDGTGYEDQYNAVINPFLVDTKAPTNVSLSEPLDGATNVSLTPTLIATIAQDMTSVMYKFQVAPNPDFDPIEQQKDWGGESSWTLPNALTTNTVYYLHVKAKDEYGNESPWCGPIIDTSGYTTITTTQYGNYSPTVPYVSASQLTDGSKRVLITYTVVDKESDKCDLTHNPNQAQYYTDSPPTYWHDANLSGTTSGITTAPDPGITHSDLFWQAGVNLNNAEMNNAHIRIKLHDGFTYQQNYAATAPFVLDTKAPVISSPTAFQTTPKAGDTSITLKTSWTESNPNTSLFYYALDGTIYSSGIAGTTNTTNPTATIDLSTSLTGASYFDKIKSTATDDFGNTSSESEDLTDVGVKPYMPDPPIAQKPSYTSAEVSPNKHPSEVDGLDYAIYITPAVEGNNYVQADGSVGASAVWRTIADWGIVKVVGLASGTTYNFKTKSRNAKVNSVESDWSDVAGITTPIPGEAWARADYSYDVSGDAFAAQVWLEQLGMIVYPEIGATATINIFDSSGTQLNSSPITSNVTDSQGIWWLSWDPAAGTGFVKDTNYLAQVTVSNGGNIYTTSLLVNISIPQTVSDISATVSDIGASVGADLATAVSDIKQGVEIGIPTQIDTLKTDLQTDIGALQTDVTAVKTAVGAGEETTLYDRVTQILQDTGTTIPAAIVSEAKKGVRSKILNRPTTAIKGETIAIRYKTDSGLEPKITVYDANNAAKISAATMTEIDASGIYEYDVIFSASWDVGDYTILCSESTTGSADSMTIAVGEKGSLDYITSQVETLVTSLNVLSTDVAEIINVIGTSADPPTANTLSGKLTGVSSVVNSLTDKWGAYTTSDIIENINTLEQYLGSPNDAAGTQTIFGKMAQVYDSTGNIPSFLPEITKVYNYIQKLEEDIKFNGKSSTTAYELIDTINSSVKDIKGLVVKTSQDIEKFEIDNMSSPLKEAQEALKDIIAKEGLKGKVIEEEISGVPATLESIQSQISRLEALVEAIKESTEKGKDAVIKTWLEPGSVKLKMIVINPSETEKKTISAKSYLPKGVSSEDIIERGDFQIGYDFDKSLYYVYQDVSLEPKETRTLEIVMQDLWVLSDEEINILREHTAKLIEALKNTEYYEQAKILSTNIIDRINTIVKQQNAIGLSIEERLSNYETNVAILEDIKKDIAILEDLVIEVGGLPGDKILGESFSTAESVKIDISNLDMDKLGTVKFKMEIANQSSEEKTVPLKYYFPVEVKPEHIVDNAGLEVVYDYQRGLYYVYTENVLAQGEKKEFVVLVKDIWVIPDEHIQVLTIHTKKLMDMLKGSEYQNAAIFLGNRAIATLDGILTVQNTPYVNAETHIGDYRINLKRFDDARKDITKLERLVIQAGGSPGITLVNRDIKIKEGGIIPAAGGVRAGISGVLGAIGLDFLSKSIFGGKAPNITTTWKVIWIIIGFLGLMSILFFIVWWRQIKIGEKKKQEQVKQEQKE